MDITIYIVAGIIVLLLASIGAFYYWNNRNKEIGTKTKFSIFNIQRAGFDKPISGILLGDGEGDKYDRVNTTGLVTGRDVMILVPNANSAKPYNAAVPTPFLMYHHGSSETYSSLLDDALKTTTVDALLDAGYICAGISAGATNWGNQDACDAYEDLYNTVKASYNISHVLFLSQSMGGMTGLVCLAQQNVPYVIAWAGIYPACNLTKIYASSPFTGDINTAYSCNSIPSCAIAYAGHDPCLFTYDAYRSVSMRFYASEGDTSVIKADNTDVFQAIVAGTRPESDIVVCTGNHGDVSHFQPADLVAFYERNIGYQIRSEGNVPTQWFATNIRHGGRNGGRRR